VFRKYSKPDRKGEEWNRYAAVVQLSTTQPLAHQPLSSTGERIGRAKARKLMGQDKDRLINKRKKKNKTPKKLYKGNHLPPPTSELMSSQTPCNCYLPSLSVHSVFIAEHDIIWHIVSLWCMLSAFL